MAWSLRQTRDDSLYEELGVQEYWQFDPTGMRVRDYRQQGRRAFFRLSEKGGRFNEVPAHHTATEYVDAYLAALGEVSDRDAPLFRAAEAPGRLACSP